MSCFETSWIKLNRVYIRYLANGRYAQNGFMVHWEACVTSKTMHLTRSALLIF